MNKEEILLIIKSDLVSISKQKALLLDMNTVDIAEILEKLDKEKFIKIFRLLPKVIASDVFSYLDNDNQQIINQILQYPDDSAGSIMTTEYVVLSEDTKVREAFDTIRITGLKKETIYTCYVIRNDRLLIGVVTAKALMLARPQDRIGDLMDTNIIFAKTTDDQEVIAEQFHKYSLLAMPVVDKEKRLVGIITVDDIVDVIIEENTEDIEKMGGLVPSDEPYIKTRVFKLAKNRIVWLLLLMLSATLTGIIISNYEAKMVALPVLMVFIPLLMDTGGNAGSQTSTLIIRGMAVGEISPKNVFRILWKEARIAMLVGFGLGIINFIWVYVIYGQNLLLSTAVTLTLFITLLTAKILGCILPLLAKRLKIDPAVMATPMITTINDALSLVIYFSIAKVIFGI